MRVIGRVFLYLFIIIFLLLNIYRFGLTVRWGISVYKIFMWLGVGMAGYFILRLLFRKNEKWLQTFSHELSHTVVGLMFFRKIHSFQAKEGEGQITHSGKRSGHNIFISLAPYCLPIFTYLFLFLGLMSSPEYLYVFEILIGFTLAFHLTCFAKQTGRHQTDITNHGIILSYIFITAFLLFNVNIILLSIDVNVIQAFKQQFVGFWSDLTYVYDFAAAKIAAK